MCELSKTFKTGDFAYDICYCKYSRDILDVLWETHTHWSIASSCIGIRDIFIGKSRMKKLYSNAAEVLSVNDIANNIYFAWEWPLTRTAEKSSCYLAIGKTDRKSYNKLIESSRNLLWKMNVWEDLCLYNMNSNTIGLVECFHEGIGLIFGNKALFNDLNLVPYVNRTYDSFRIHGKALSSDNYRVLEQLFKDGYND